MVGFPYSSAIQHYIVCMGNSQLTQTRLLLLWTFCDKTDKFCQHLQNKWQNYLVINRVGYFVICLNILLCTFVGFLWNLPVNWPSSISWHIKRKFRRLSWFSVLPMLCRSTHSRG